MAAPQPYLIWQAGETAYKLRLSAIGATRLEADVGSILSIFQNMQGSIPSLELTLKIIHASMSKYHPDMKLEDTYNAYDDYVDGGGDLTTLFAETLLEVLRVSGFLPRESEDTKAPSKRTPAKK